MYACLIAATLFTVPSHGAEPLPRVATFKADVTLPIGHPCYTDYKPVKTIEHPQFAKGIVLEDGKTKNRYVICTFDWCEICNGSHDLVREKIAKAVGTTVDRVMVLSVHQHTAPMAVGDAQRLLDKTKKPAKAWDLKVLDELFSRAAKAAGEAVENLQPFNQVGTSEAKVERVAANRRILGEDGKIHMRWSATTDPDLIAAPEGLIDPMLKTITFAKDGKPLVRMHYYAVHPQSFYRDERMSYDFVGMAREKLEKEDGAYQIYFTGCTGDITAGKYNQGTRENRTELADRLYDGMKRSVAATKYAPVGPIRWRTAPLTAAPQFAEKAHAYEKKLSNPREKTHQRVFAAQDLAFLKRIDRPFFLCSLELGDVSMVYLPGEPCIAFQLYAQKAKPGSFVAVSGYADGGCGYICTENMFDEGGYEPSASRFAPEVDQKLRAAIDSLLGKEPTPPSE
jgi:hypothetical protein